MQVCVKCLVCFLKQLFFSTLDQVQNSKHPPFHPGVDSLHTHTVQAGLGSAGGQVRTPQAAGEHDIRDTSSTAVVGVVMSRD